jgi:hypothetical protein
MRFLQCSYISRSRDCENNLNAWTFQFPCVSVLRPENVIFESFAVLLQRVFGFELPNRTLCRLSGTRSKLKVRKPVCALISFCFTTATTYGELSARRGALDVACLSLITWRNLVFDILWDYRDRGATLRAWKGLYFKWKTMHNKLTNIAYRQCDPTVECAFQRDAKQSPTF